MIRNDVWQFLLIVCHHDERLSLALTKCLNDILS